MSLQTFLVTSGIYSFIATLLLGAFVYFHNRKNPLNIFFGIFALTVGCWSLGSSLENMIPDETLALWALRICYLFAVILPSIFIQFTYLVTEAPRTEYRWIKISYAISTILFPTVFTDLFIKRLRLIEPYHFRITDPGPFYYVFLCFFSVVAFKILFQMHQAKKHAIGQRRKQLHYIFVAQTIAVIAAFDYFSRVLKLINFPPIDDYILLIYFLIFTYAVIKHQVLNIATVAHKTLMWFITSSILLSPFAFLFGYFREWFYTVSDIQLFALLLAILSVLIPYLKIVQPYIDHLFQRRKYDLQRILQETIKELAVLKDLKGLTEKLAVTINEGLYVSHISILLWDKKRESYSLLGSNLNIDPAIHKSFLKWMGEEDRIIEATEIEIDTHHTEIKEPGQKYFQAFLAKVALPLVHDGRLIGVINLGEKNNLKPFSHSDIEFLSTLRAQSIIALSNSLLYEDVHKMSEELRNWAAELEEKVLQRTHELSERTKELSQSKTELEHSYQKLQELDKLKSEFFANISHEFRTPLTLILAPLESFLNQPNHPEEQRRHFQVMYQNGLRLLKLINNLLDLAKIDTGKMALSYSKTDLVAFIQGILSSLTPLTYKKQIHLSFLADRSVVEFYFDRDKIEKVLLNLLFNAIKFTERGGEIILSCEEKDGHVLVKVSDTGIGIARENLHKLFSRFTQLDASATRQHEGTGIGLALSKELVELHQGKIWAESEIGRGTVISFTLPSLKEKPISSLFTPRKENSEENWFRSLHKTAEYAERGIVQEPASPPPQIATGEENRPKILIVEDNPDMLHFIATLLQDDYHVIPAQNGVEGVERAKRDLPDLILADVMMPIKDGYQLCREIKEDVTTRHIPIVLVTAKADLSMKIEGLKQGADDYLTKPFSSEELKARVRSLLNLRLLEKEIQIRNQVLEKTLSELRKTQTQLVHSAKMAALGTLVAGLSHEMNNPLTPVIGFAELLLGMPLPKEAHQCADTISREARRCAAIIRNLSDFAHKSPLVWEENDLNTLIHSVLELKASYLRTDNIALELDLDPHLPKTLVDGNQIKQVLLIILNNAHHALLMNEDDRRIRIASEQTGGFLRITIGDNGPGIPKEVQPRIFEPFFTTKPEGEGTGLGLSVSYGIIQSHGGKIGFISEEGIGTRFWFELPIRTAASTAPNLLPEVATQYQNRRALVVDDEPMVLEICKAALEQIGFVVDAVHSGEAALGHLTKTSYDLLVSDIRMPGMDGIQFLDQVTRVYPEVLERTIIITGDAANSVTSAFLDRTHAAVLEKPFDLTDLQRLAKSILQRNSIKQWRA